MIAKSEFKETEAGIIPEDWEVTRLGDACTKIGSGITPRGAKKVYKESGIGLIRSQNVYNNSFNPEGLVYLDETTSREMDNVALERDDVLLNITGDSVARCCTVPEEVLPARVNQHVSIIRPDGRRLNPIFLRYYLTSPKMQALMISLAQSGGTRNALTKGMIENFLVPEPRLEEQSIIAQVLSNLDDKIELNQQMNKTLEAIAGAIFKHWFVDFEFPNEDGKPFKSAEGEMVYNSELGREIPIGWTVKKLNELSQNFDSKRIPLSSRERESRKGAYRYFGATGILDYLDDFIFDGTYILMGEDGSVVDDTGHPILQYVWGKFWVNNHAHVLSGAGVSNELLYLFLRNTDVRPIVTGAVQPKINQNNMNKLRYCIPPPSTLSRIERIIQPMFSKFKTNSDGIDALSQIRDSLLPMLMSGKIRVPVEVR